MVLFNSMLFLIIIFNSRFFIVYVITHTLCMSYLFISPKLRIHASTHFNKRHSSFLSPIYGTFQCQWRGKAWRRVRLPAFVDPLACITPVGFSFRCSSWNTDRVHPWGIYLTFLPSFYSLSARTRFFIIRQNSCRLNVEYVSTSVSVPMSSTGSKILLKICGSVIDRLCTSLPIPPCAYLTLWSPR